MCAFLFCVRCAAQGYAVEMEQCGSGMVAPSYAPTRSITFRRQKY